MEGQTDPPQPQLHGFVIITLPPPGDPSKGKTITAFTLSDPSTTTPLPPPRPPRQLAPNAAASRLRPRIRSLGFSPKKAALSALGAAVVLFSLWAVLFSEAPLQLLGDAGEEAGRNDDDSRSFVFPLYPKTSGRILREVGDVRLASAGARDVAGAVGGTRKWIKLAASSVVNSSVVLPLGGNLFPDGQYYTTLFIGNSPRPYFLDVDSGSDLTWIQCDAPCSNCAQGPHPLYKPTRGNIVSPGDSLCLELQKDQKNRYCDSCKQCDYEIDYADHSSSMGVLARDKIHLHSENNDDVKLEFVFGCAYDQQGQLLASPAKTDGILGLSSSKVSLPSQLQSQGIINNVIAHCIRTEADGGYMFLGDDFVPLWGMTWIPTRNGVTNFYRSDVSKIIYGGQQLSVGGKEPKEIPIIFDSGSSYTYFPNEVYGELMTSLKYAINGLVQDESDLTLPVCWRAQFPFRSVRDVKRFFEPLTLQFGKKWWVLPRAFTIPPEGYLMISSKGNVCLGVLNGTEVHDGSTIILGDISLRGKLVVYDNVQQRIGWSQSACARPQKPRGFPFLF